MKLCFSILLCCVVSVAQAQRGRQLTPVYVPGTAYKNTGWFISPGITYMLPENRKENLTSFVGNGDVLDTLYSGDFKRGGKIGLYVEAGRHKFISDRILIHHIDYGVHFKMLRGKETFNGIVNAGGAFVPVESRSKFSDSFVGAFFNASNIIQISNPFWIQNSIGVNADFRVIQRHIGGAPYGADWNFPSTLLAQIHYKLGFGWKPEPGMYIIPSIETPLLNVFPWDKGKSTLQYFVGRDRPFILTVKIQWLSKAGSRKCEGQPGSGPELDKAGHHKSSDLWGPQNNKMKRKREK
jgi:hypothetical protein